MAKEKESNNSSGKQGGAAGAVLIGLKFVLALLLLPLVIATVRAMTGEVAQISEDLRSAIVTGTLAYVLMKFFVYDFDEVYKFGQSIVGWCFQFLKPVMNFAPYVIPIYTIMAIMAYAVLNVMGKMGKNAELSHVFFILIAFTFAMHVILTAQDLYKKDSIAGKPNYFFTMSLIFILDVFVMALLIRLASSSFSFVHFFQALSAASAQIYGAILRQLFLR